MKKSQKLLSGVLLSVGSMGLVASAISCQPEKWNPKEDKVKEDKKVEKLRVGADFIKGLDKSFKEVKTTFINDFNHQIEDDKVGSKELKVKYREQKNKLLSDINSYRNKVAGMLTEENTSIEGLQKTLESLKKQKDKVVKDFLDKGKEILESYKQEKGKSQSGESSSDATPPSENPDDEFKIPDNTEERIESSITILSREVAVLYLNEFKKYYQVEGLDEKINSLKHELESKKYDISVIQDLIKEKLGNEFLKSELDYYVEKYLPIRGLYHFRTPEIEKITLDNVSLYENGVKYSLSDPEVLKKVLKTEFGTNLGVNSNTIQEGEVFKVRITDTINKTDAPEPGDGATKPNYNYDPNNNWFIKWTDEDINNKEQGTWVDEQGDKEKLRNGEGVYLDGVIRGDEERVYDINSDAIPTYRKLDHITLKYALFRLHVKEQIKTMVENGSFIAVAENFKSVLLKDLLELPENSFVEHISDAAKDALESTYVDGLQAFKQYSDLVANEPSHFEEEYSRSLYYYIKYLQRLTMAFTREINKPEHGGKYLPVYDKINAFMNKLTQFVNNGNHELPDTIGFLEEFKENYLTWLKDKENIDSPSASNGTTSSEVSEEEQTARNTEFARVFDEQIAPLETEMDSILTNIEGKAFLSTEKMQLETQYKPFITKNKELKEQGVNISQTQLEQIKSFAGLWSSVKSGIESQIRDWTLIVESKPEGEERNAYIETIGKLRVAYNITNQFGMFLHRVANVGRNDFTSVQMSDLNHLINDYNAQNFDVDFITGFYDIETNDQGSTVKVKEDKTQLLSKENANALYEKMKEFTNAKVQTFNTIANNDARTTKYLIDAETFKIS